MSTVAQTNQAAQASQSTQAQPMSFGQFAEALKKSDDTVKMDTSDLFKGTSFYATVDVQFSAAKGPEKVQVDRKAAQAVLSSMKGQGDGRVSLADWKQTVLPRIADGFNGEPEYGKGESPIARLILAAVDDRKTVMLDGDQINLTNPAEQAAKSDLAKFWGGIGGRASAAARSEQPSAGQNPFDQRPSVSQSVAAQSSQSASQNSQSLLSIRAQQS